MKKVIKIVSTQDSNTLQVRFWPTDICNFNCSYCFPGSHDNKFRYPKDTSKVLDSFRKLFDFYKTLGKTKFNITISGGGEPTIWPELHVFCNEIRKNHNVSIGLVTNGSRTVRWWEENAEVFDSVTVSCHNEFVDIDHTILVADLLWAAGTKVTALVLMDANNWDKCVSLVDRMQLSKHPWFIEPKPIVDAPSHGMDCYTKEQLNYITLKRIPDSAWIFKRLNELRIHESVSLFDDDTAKANQPHEIITNNWNKFYDWECGVGIEAISVTASGDVLGSCQVPVFSQPVNIFNQIPKLALNSINCPKLDCSCQPDTHVTKSLVL